MLWKMNQHTFAGGRLDKELMGRQDLAAYFKGASELKNLVVRRQGGLSKRRGTNLACDLSALGDMTGCRLIPLVYDNDNGYYLLFYKVGASDTFRISLLSRNGIRAGTSGVAFESSYSSASYFIDSGIPKTVDLDKMDYFQSGDTVFLAHRDFFPRRVVFTKESATLEMTKLPINSMSVNYSAPTKPTCATSGTKATAYLAPVISGISNADRAGTNVYRYYKVSYVDALGIESPVCSAKNVYVGSTTFGTTTLTVTKGSNTENPAKYNVYRSNDTAAANFRKIGEITSVDSSGGGTFTDAGLEPTDQAPNPDVVKTYYYASSYVDGSGIESVASPASGAVKIYSWGTSGTVTVTCAKGSNSANPAKYCIYRGTSTTVSTFGKIGEITSINSSGGGTFTDDNTTQPGDSPSASTSGCPALTATKKSLTNKTSSSKEWSEQTGTERTVYYKCSAVFEDGSESVASSAVAMTYISPWPDTGCVQISCSKGTLNKTPKSYNVYKKTTSEYGLIGVIDGSAGSMDDDYITPDMSETPLDVEQRFSSEGEYPGTVSMYQQRLVMAGTNNDPFTFHMSTTGDLYNFNVHSSMREDDAIEATLPATEMPEINHAVMSRDLILFTSGGEWEVAPVSGNAISYKTVSAKMQSAIGSAKWIKPITIGDEIIFVDGTGENMLATRYSYASDGYESKDLTIMSKWIFHNNGIRRMCYKRSPDSAIVCVLGDGEIAELAYMKEHEVCAWSRHVLAGGYLAKDCASSKALSNGTTEVMILVSNANGTAWEAWTVRDDVPVRSNPSVADHVCMDRCWTSTGGGTVGVARETIVDTSTASAWSGGSYLGAGSYVVGIQFESKLVTVHPEPNGNDTIQMEVKNATEVEARVVDSSSFLICANADPEHKKTIFLVPTASSGVITLADKDVRIPISGTNTRDGRILLTHNEPFTFNLTSLATTYQVETANQNGGGNG